MKKSKITIFILLPWAILSGLFLTLAFTGQENFKQLPAYDCFNPAYLELQVKTVACATLEKGFPYRFLSAAAGASTTNYPNSGDKILDIASNPKIETYHMIVDIAIWSAVSLAALWIITRFYQPKRKYK